MSEMVTTIDDLGRPAWIALMVLGFVVFWPVGLVILAFLLWSNRMGMGCGRSSTWGEHPKARWERKMARLQEKVQRFSAAGGGQAWAPGGGMGATGNQAFDEYRTETLKRLEEEARAFKGFLERLRHAKDKAEFDQFMADRRNNPDAGGKPDDTSGRPPQG